MITYTTDRGQTWAYPTEAGHPFFRRACLLVGGELRPLSTASRPSYWPRGFRAAVLAWQRAARA